MDLINPNKTNMKAEINDYGSLVVTAETNRERVDLLKWCDDQPLQTLDSPDLIVITNTGNIIN